MTGAGTPRRQGPGSPQETARAVLKRVFFPWVVMGIDGGPPPERRDGGHPLPAPVAAVIVQDMLATDSRRPQVVPVVLCGLSGLSTLGWQVETNNRIDGDVVGLCIDAIFPSRTEAEAVAQRLRTGESLEGTGLTLIPITSPD